MGTSATVVELPAVPLIPDLHLKKLMTTIALRLFYVVFPAILVLTAPLGAQTANDKLGWGLSVSGAVTAAPLGPLSERTGLLAIPGGAYGLRVLRRTSPVSEWSAGFVSDEYGIDLAGC